LAGWIVAGFALHPMERMRQQASAITASGLDHRLTVPAARDELQRLARTLNDMLERLDQSLVRERAFLERASHELRTPLAALRAEVDLSLRRQRSAEELTAALRSVSQETDRLARLAEDLLVLARADDGRLPLHRQDVSLRETLESAAAMFVARAGELDVTLAVAAPETTLHVDPLRLRQALVNLLDNALRHTPRAGTVRLTATVSDAQARIVVSDTGPGFVYDGDAVGLGLRIVHAVAASHRGTVRIWRKNDGGASVEISLPLASAAHDCGVGEPVVQATPVAIPDDGRQQHDE
jgi:two-component system OmpR family sensor kinase